MGCSFYVVKPDNSGVTEKGTDFLLLMKHRVFTKTAVVAISPAGCSSQYDENVVSKGTIKRCL
jgi:hypothetical protein